jgi:hypothetical protein
MSWKLFLDDERDPVGDGWVVCRSLKDAVAKCDMFGLPSFVSFDHDLGHNYIIDDFENTGMGFANWIVHVCLEGKHAMPEDFDWYVHCQNPIGAENIQKLMESWKKHNVT